MILTDEQVKEIAEIVKEGAISVVKRELGVFGEDEELGWRKFVRKCVAEVLYGDYGILESVKEDAKKYIIERIAQLPEDQFKHLIISALLNK